MTQILKSFIVPTILTLVAFAGLAVIAPAVADAQASVVCDGVDAATSNLCSDEDSTPGLNGILTTALNILSIVAGVTAVIMFMLGGAKYITSQGDPSSTTSARNTLIYAAIGLVIVVAAQTIVFFAIDQATGTVPDTPPCGVGGGPC